MKLLAQTAAILSLVLTSIAPDGDVRIHAPSTIAGVAASTTTPTAPAG